MVQRWAAQSMPPVTSSAVAWSISTPVATAKGMVATRAAGSVWSVGASGGGVMVGIVPRRGNGGDSLGGNRRDDLRWIPSAG